MINFNKTILKNGLHLLTAPMKETQAVTILIAVGAGSRYEDAENNGVAHFLEHMFFKGTTKRPSTLEISKELDAMGADYNAFTGEELTGFYVRVAGSDFDHAFDIITDMLLDPLFIEEEIEREKGVIVEELNMYKDTPMRAIGDDAKALIYGNTPLGRNIGGTSDIVTKFSKKNFINFRDKYYRPDNLIVTIVGAGDDSRWQKAVEEKFGNLDGSADKNFEQATFDSKRQIALSDKKTDQAHLILSYPSFAYSDARRPILQALRSIIGGTMSSRLFIEVRERRGLAYYVRSNMWEFRDTGVLATQAGVQVNKIDEAIEVIQDQFAKIRDEMVTEEELERAKSNLRGSLSLDLEDSMEIAQYLVENDLFMASIKQPEELIEGWNSVTRNDIRSLAQEIFVPEKAQLAIIGPYEKPERFEKLIK